MYWTSNATQCHPFDSGALAKLDISFNYDGNPGGRYNKDKGSEEFIRPISTMLKTNKTIKEINLAGNNLNAEAGRIFSQDIHDNGALAFVNLLGNDIPPEQAQELIKVMESKENLKTLCGFKGDEKELDLSKKNLKAGCAVLVSHEIQDMGALASMTFRDKKPVTINTTMTEADFSGAELGVPGAIILAAWLKHK